MMISQRCIIADITVTGNMYCKHGDDGDVYGIKHGDSNAYSRQYHRFREISWYHKRHHGKLAENDVAECIERVIRMLALGPFGTNFFRLRPLLTEAQIEL
ncbi:hypothetical protein KIN20_030638 [Parelaphostrongylus tenuis]|uniref:Uncharacterized protein n=1 Tax=Parelaphostrongylus tenuis TaxID=148309 RepID=A0AAD5R417_PARTN|nr:hypothetical protein KIN20_030638 [Parelaphostrongylus tenuis]